MKKTKQEESADLNYIDRCLSMVLHHDEIRQISAVIRRVLSKREKFDDPGVRIDGK